MSCRWISRTPKRSWGLWLQGVCVLVLLGTTLSYALASPLAHVPRALKVGEGRLRYLFWDVYDAALYAPRGVWSNKPPFALRLSYLRPIAGVAIAERSVREMHDQGFNDAVMLDIWHQKMRDIFPDVDEGVSLTGIYTLQGSTIFYKDMLEIGRVPDPEFGRAFFAIWLGERTSFPALRRQLLGLP